MEHVTPAENDLHSARCLRLIASPGRFLAVIATYFALQILPRLITSNTTSIDESEQLLLTQQLALGYGPQPPLYTWLQFPLVAILGPTVLPLAIFKNLLLFGIYAITYFNARLVTRNHWLSVAAAVSLLFIPQISWESQRDLTHSVLLTLAAVAAFHFYLRMGEHWKVADYLAFGLCVGLGLLTKYNFIVFLFGLVIASLTLPRLRDVMVDKRMLPALLVAAGVVAPHTGWAMQNTEAVIASMHTFKVGGAQSWAGTTLAGLGNLLGSVAAHVGVLVGIYSLLCWKRPASPAGDTPGADISRVIGRAIGIILSALVLAVLIFKVTNYKDRWLMPVFFWLPILLVVKCAPRLDATRIKWLVGFATVVMAVISVLIPCRVWWIERGPEVQKPNAPFDELCRQIAIAHPQTRFIIAENKWVAGNLKHFLPEKFVIPVPACDCTIPQFCSGAL